eukprot:3766772-Rhodomonas_salina.1
MLQGELSAESLLLRAQLHPSAPSRSSLVFRELSWNRSASPSSKHWQLVRQKPSQYLLMAFGQQ